MTHTLFQHFTTSPFFIFDFNNPKIIARNLIKNCRFKKISMTLKKMAFFCLEPQTKEKIIKEGFNEREFEAAVSSGVVCPVESTEFMAGKLWEKHHWTRAAYLTFSQINLSYLEENPSTEDMLSLFEVRRNIIKSQAQEFPYPDYISFGGAFTPLQKPSHAKGMSIDSIFTRKSERAFKEEHITLTQLSSLLFDATEEIRIINDSRNEGDPLQIFNSYFSWSVIFLAIQGVESIDKGIYHYNPLKHGLTKINSFEANRDIYSCIQFQKWIGGGGICLFLCSQWDRYYWIYRHSRAYINLLIQVGELGQEFFQSARFYGLGGWGTPALNESQTKNLLGLENLPIDPLYFLKIGIPRHG